MQLCDVYISLPNSFKQHIALIISLRHYLFTNSRGGERTEGEFEMSIYSLDAWHLFSNT